MKPIPKSLHTVTEALAPIPDEMRCDFCGMEHGVSRLRGLPNCAPPFDVRPHQWTGKHPSHVGKPISKAIARHAEAMAEEIWDRWNVEARVQWRKLSGDKRDRILGAEGVETGNVRLTTYVDESLMERSRRYKKASRFNAIRSDLSCGLYPAALDKIVDILEELAA